jgi:ABC-2 type transport system ATP-binding protein
MIEVSNLTKRFGAVTAVDDLSFTVRPGRVTGFLGPNGAGKSTTMRLILGLDRPTAGTATVCGRALRDAAEPARTVGALIDAGWVHPHRSARAHLRWIAAAGRIPQQRVDAVLEQVGLAGVARRRVAGFSLGMRQRLGIAAALLGEPEVLVLDEPANGLDPDGILWLRALLHEYAAQGRTVLLSSHLLAEMTGTVDHVVVIGRGRLVAEQSVDAFLESSATTRVRVRVDAPDRLAAALEAAGHPVTAEGPALLVEGLRTDDIGELARAVDCTVWELAAQTVSLEEAFMKATGDAVEFSGGRR